MDDFFTGLFDNFVHSATTTTLKEKFPEYKQYVEKDDFHSFLQKEIAPFLVREIKLFISKNFEKFEVCTFPLNIEIVILDIYASEVSQTSIVYDVTFFFAKNGAESDQAM